MNDLSTPAADLNRQAAATPQADPPLRLAALDVEDLAIVSTHLQDATVQVGDMAYLPGTRRFALVAARFDWVKAARGVCERCSTGLHFERVLSVKRAGFAQDTDATLNLAAIMFQPRDAPAGTVLLSFTGGAAIRLEVECVEAALSDLGPRWVVPCKPAGWDEGAGG